MSYYIEPNSTELIAQIALKYDSYDDEKNPWFISHDFEKGEWEKISEDDFNEFLGRISSYVKFDYTPFAK